MITIEDLKKKQTETSRLIGLDLGSKRIGVSICDEKQSIACLLYTSPSPRDRTRSRMPSSA